MTRFAFEVPIRTVTGMNVREHHFARARRVKNEHKAVACRFPVVDLAPVVFVHLVRISPGDPDDDAVAPALKGVRDAIAKKLKLDDACRLVRFTYAAEKGPKLSVRVEMEVPTR